MRQECRTSKSVASCSCDWLLLEHLHPLAATGTPTGAGPVPNRVPGRRSRQPPPPHRSHSGSRLQANPIFAPGFRQTLNSALNIVFRCWELPVWNCHEFGVRKWPLHLCGQGAKFGVASPVSTVAASPVADPATQNPRGGPLACPLAPTVEMLLVLAMRATGRSFHCQVEHHVRDKKNLLL